MLLRLPRVLLPRAPFPPHAQLLLAGRARALVHHGGRDVRRAALQRGVLLLGDEAQVAVGVGEGGDARGEGKQQQEEAEQRERASKKAAADRLLGRWGDKHRGDVYEMMRTIHLFTDIFAEDPMANVALTRGDTTALKKAWHKLAAKLHPDRQRAAPTAPRT